MNSAEVKSQGPEGKSPDLEVSSSAPRSRRGARNKKFRTLSELPERMAGNAFLLPAILMVLFLAIFPLIVSAYLSVSRIKFIKGGYEINFVGLANYKKLLTGSEQTHFLGKFGDPSPIGWIIFWGAVVAMTWGFIRYVLGDRRTVIGTIGRIVAVLIMSGALYLLIHVMGSDGRPGTIVVTWIYVFVGITFQYSIALGLALLVTQNIPGRRFFRIVYLIPMMITPVGVAYLFRMLTDTDKGPFQPIWQAMGLGLYSWVTDPWGARVAIMIGDIWQWTPFMFIVLVAALETQSMEQFEAALVDGANKRQIFRFITFPQILPVTLTLILIRLIEAFKIVDLPNVMTNGGPGTATESMTLQAFFNWRALDLGGSAAIAYMLLFVVTFIGIAYVNLIRSRATEA
jgi:multiple sugar transport system permease protein